MEKRDYNGFKPVSGIISGIVKPYTNEKTPLIIRLTSDWHLIVGSDLAEKTKPTKISFSQSGNKSGTLLMDVYEGIAAEIQYMIPDIMDRIATYFGYRLVDKIKFRQVHMDIPVPPHTETKRKLNTEEQEKINNMLAGIKDDGLNSALQSLLTTAYTRKK